MWEGACSLPQVECVYPQLRCNRSISRHPYQVIIHLPTHQRLDLNRHRIQLSPHPDSLANTHRHIPQFRPETLGLAITDHHRQAQPLGPLRDGPCFEVGV